MLPPREISLGQAAPPRAHAHGQRYPQPAADHQAVCDDAALFLETLEKLQRQLGINEKVPRVGGRELHLHTLYRQVTSLGGCEQVIARKQWREVAEPFHFPETITSVSYSLRKAYINHLWDYEQVYYFQRQGPRLTSPAGIANGGANGFDEEYTRPGKKRKTHNDVVATTFPSIHPSTPVTLTASAIGPGAPAAACVGQRGTVVIDSRFDAGYFVTVRIGKQDFRGMLYYPPPESLMDLSPLAHPRKAGRPRKEEDQGKPSKKDKASRDRDPLAPKPNKTPFNFFSVDARVKAKDVYPAMSQTDITKKVGEMWQNASEEEKSPYVAMSNQDKARYQAELESYNFRLASQAAAQQASQAAVAVSAAQHAMASQPLQRVLGW
ncbi:hypothetical protein WJX84_008807 [Apatococcus fuscideae]|uniref:Uncharacterized protein n=1 Tax=Apatococcus fuscideae TaxID=2026836 RepID=A0AAW1T487_9CHLO